MSKKLDEAVRLQKKVRRAIAEILPRYVRLKKKFAKITRVSETKEAKKWSRRRWKRYHKMRDNLRLLWYELVRWQLRCKHLGHPPSPSKDVHCPCCHSSKSEQYELRNLGVFG